VQVLRRGTLFAARATQLYDAYQAYPSLEDLPAAVRERIEKDVLRDTLADAWASTREFWLRRDPREVDRALAEPRHRMALVFRSYLGLSSRWAIDGDPTRQADYQIWCGPAIGAFNRWVAGSPLAVPAQRSVTQIALNLLEGAATITSARRGVSPPSPPAVVRSTMGQVPVAVVGLAAIMPGARNVTEYWHNIVTGRDLITDVPATHWSPDDFYDPDPAAPDKTFGRRGAFLPEIEFDPLAHGLPPTTLAALDPAQLMGLVVADQLLADLDDGLTHPMDRERVSVILGSSTLSRVGTMDARIQRPVWREALRAQGIDDATAEAVCDRISARYVPWQEATFPGLLSNVVAGRIANRLDLHGTNCTIDAACASSLAALTSAVTSCRWGWPTS
jgi:hypothetical protein